MPALLAVLVFAFQLYLDFSAYSDIAIGGARTLGFKLSLNFNRPYLSSSFGDFWKRWHISLSSWFRDYVYIPLGGNKRSKRRTLINIALVFILSGLWHGASFNFILWGMINAFFLIAIDPVLTRRKGTNASNFFASVLIVSLWSLSLILFRAPTFSDAGILFKNLFESGATSVLKYGLAGSEFKFLIWMLSFLLLFEIAQERNDISYSWFVKKPFVFRWLVYFTITSSIILLGSYGSGLNDSSFIYFQF
jgi:D-alanyl-lipoteichoic acid acyltransferase DltB (MBOAT superfamily)